LLPVALLTGCGASQLPSDAGSDSAVDNGTQSSDGPDGSADLPGPADAPGGDSALESVGDSGNDVAPDAAGQDGSPGDGDGPDVPADGGGGQDVAGDGGGQDVAGGRDSGPDAVDGGTVAPIGRNVGCAPSATLWSGADTLIDAFPSNDGIIVVTAGAVNVLSRTGMTVKSYTPPRPLTAAAFDGALLVLADAAYVTVMTPTLASKGTILLKEACAAGVMVGAQRFVCGPMNDWDRIFYTYDLVQLALVGTSPKYTYEGIPMRQVPGRDHFVTVGTSGTPADFSLFRVDALGPVYFLGESPYHGDFAVSTIYAFAGRPATHLVTSEGLMLKLFTPQCLPDSTSVLGSGCFVKDGNIGTLWANEMFRAMATDDERDVVYGVVGTLDNFRMLTCAGQCKVQQIDAVQRVVLGQRGYGIGMSQTITTRHDTQCQMLLFGYRTNDATPVNRLDLLEHGGN